MELVFIVVAKQLIGQVVISMFKLHVLQEMNIHTGNRVVWKLDWY